MAFTYISEDRRRDEDGRSNRQYEREAMKEPKAFKTALGTAVAAGFWAYKMSKGDKLIC